MRHFIYFKLLSNLRHMLEKFTCMDVVRSDDLRLNFSRLVKMPRINF